jgi:hypothetical protein
MTEKVETGEQVVTPWEVDAGEGIIDYEKLIRDVRVK